jgi:hypothetical protein
MPDGRSATAWKLLGRGTRLDQCTHERHRRLMAASWRRHLGGSWGFRRFGTLEGMGQREKPVVEGTATEQERAEARDRFRRKLAEAEARMTPEKRAEVRAALGLDASAA